MKVFRCKLVGIHDFIPGRLLMNGEKWYLENTYLSVIIVGSRDLFPHVGLDGNFFNVQVDNTVVADILWVKDVLENGEFKIEITHTDL
jgi:hypothetical protein